MKVFSCDLSDGSKKYLAFLHKLHEMDVMTAPVIQQSVDRYLHCWLPMLAEMHRCNEACVLVPPPDVAWLFHCHRLATGPYRKFIVRQFQDEWIDESCQPFVFQDEEQEASKEATETRVEWNRRYPEHAFFLSSQDQQTSEPSEQSAITKTACDMDGFQLVASVQAQAKFLWQVSDPRFQDESFLQHSVDRYHKFLQLSGKFHREHGIHKMIVPTYDIDLMWHTHILYSISQYESDCICIRGSFLSHDDSLDDRSEGSDLEIAFQQTCEAWQEAYYESYVDPTDAAMYRREPPIEYSVSNLSTCQLNENAITAELKSKDCSASNVSCFESKERSLTGLPNPTMRPTPLEVYKEIPWVKPLSNLVPGEDKLAFVTVSSGVYLKRDGYVFGQTTLGVGYYSFCTREAYQILQEKLRRKGIEAERKLREHDMYTCRFCFRKPTTGEANRRTRLEQNVKRLRSFRRFASIQYKAAGPYKRLCDDYPSVSRNVKPFPLNCVLDEENLKGITLGDVCDAVDCGGVYSRPVAQRATPTSSGRGKSVKRDGGWGFAIGAACGGGGCGGGGCGGC